MNTMLTDQDRANALNALNLIFQAAMVSERVGLVPAASVAQREGLEEAGTAVAQFIQKTGEPTATLSEDNMSDTAGLDVVTPPPPAAKKK